MISRQSSARPILRIVFFCLFSVGFAAMILLIPLVSRQFSHWLPENYRYIASRAMRSGEFDRALQVADRRLSTAYYDFEAHEVKAGALSAMGDPVSAVDEMLLVLRKLPAARARNLPATGFDEARTLALLARYLWEAGRFRDSGDVARASLDAGAALHEVQPMLDAGLLTTTVEARLAAASLALRRKDAETFDKLLDGIDTHDGSSAMRVMVLRSRWAEQVDDDTTTAREIALLAASAAPTSSPLAIATLAGLAEVDGDTTSAAGLRDDLRSTPGFRVVMPGEFTRPEGAAVNNAGLLLPRNGAALASVSTGVFTVTSLFIQARGTSALGSYPLIAVRAGGQEIARLYLDGPQPAVFDLIPWASGAPKMLELEVEFTNDLYEPVTKADRNVILELVALH